MIRKSSSLPFNLGAGTLRKIVFFLNLGLLSISVIALYMRPVGGFELSFYGASGTLVWVLLGLVLVSTILTAFFDILTSKEAPKRFPVEILVILGATNLIILLAPYVRGYQSYGRSDSWPHVGHVLDIVAETQPAADPYPAVHMLHSVLSSVTGLHPAVLVRYMPVFIYLFYWCGLYLLAGQCFPGGNGRLLTMLFGMSLINPSLYMEILAMSFGIALTPFLVYLWLKAYHSGSSIIRHICWVILCFAVPFFHPLYAILVIATLLVSGVLQEALSGRAARSSGEAKGLPALLKKIPFGSVALIIVVVLFLWLWQNWRTWQSAVIQADAALQDPFWRSTLSVDYRQVQRAKMTVPETLLIGFRIYGHLLMYVIMSVYAAFLLLFWNRKKQPSPFLRGVATWFVGLSLGTVVGVLSGLGTWRLLVTLASLSPVLIVSIPRFRRFLDYRKRRWTFVLLAVVAIFVHISAMLTFFTDPYTHRVNSHITRAERAGMEWFLRNKRDYPTRSLTWRLRQSSTSLFGKNFESANPSVSRGMSGELLVGDHFDLATTKLPRDVQKFYIPISQYDKSYHLRVFRASERFTELDFEWLSVTQAASLIYSNGDLKVFLVDACMLDSDGVLNQCSQLD